MSRKFSRGELNTLTVGMPCEWRLGRWWKEGKVIGAPQTDSLGLVYIPVHNYTRTSTVSPGDKIEAYPTFIRIRA